MKNWRRSASCDGGSDIVCPYVLSFTAEDVGGGLLNLGWNTVPNFPEDCLLHWQVQSSGGDWSVLTDESTSANPNDAQAVATGAGTFDARARVECFGAPCGGWSYVNGVEVT